MPKENEPKERAPVFHARHSVGTLRFSLLTGRKKNSLRSNKFLRLIPSKAAMLSVKEWAPKDKIAQFVSAISRSRAAQQKAEKRLGGAKRLSEASAFYEQRRAAEGQENGCTFFAASLLVRFVMQVVDRRQFCMSTTK